MSAPSHWMRAHTGVTLDDFDPDQASALAETSPRPPAAEGADGRGLGLRVQDLVGVGLRRNPKRAHLLVSTVLGKHVPTDPRIVYGSGLLLGLLVHDVLAGAPRDRGGLAALLTEALASHGETSGEDDQGPPPGEAARRFGSAARRAVRQTPPLRPAPTVLGYCETATGLGHCVADALAGSDYLHSTRRVTTVPSIAGFEEEHSHATSHLLSPHDPGLLIGARAAARPLVLVDDELTTGRTILNTIGSLHAQAPRARYVVAALVDMRDPEHEQAMATYAAQLGTRIDVVSLARGRVHLPTDLGDRAAALISRHQARRGDVSPRQQPSGTLISRHQARGEDACPAPPPPMPPPPMPPVHIEVAELGQAREGGRHGIDARSRQTLAAAMLGAAGRWAATAGERLLVLGTEEFLAAPLLLAQAFADAEPTATVRFSSTTRSPAVAVDDPDYPLRTVVQFEADEASSEPGGPDRRYAYNVRPGHDQPRWDRILLVRDLPSDEHPEPSPSRLAQALDLPGSPYTEVVIPTDDRPPSGPAWAPTLPGMPAPLVGPSFGSYRPDEVAWLLTDLSGVDLEADTEHREREIQSGRAHYAESLPIEFHPDEAYTALFAESVRESASRIAYNVGLVAEIAWQERLTPQPDDPRPGMLVSLARAGVPVGILLRRWYAFTRGADVPHYAVSIVRGRGIDTLAMDYLAAQPARPVFVDGWTGKGAITRELTAAITAYNTERGTAFDPELVVLADPGRCVRTYGTREDFLIPSACLNSTVSGLVSRTVLSDRLIGPGDFHGAKFYAGLAADDVSTDFLDAVSGAFADVYSQVQRDWPVLAASDRTPDWAGWQAVERISREYRIGQVNLVKPGVGETTRVLLRRVPERILIRPCARPDLQHVLALAEQREVPVEEVADLPYSCVGLIRPQEGGEG
ncbi:MAG: phosphoribosyltransferase domain-containing protein [Actinomycetales bacterium]